MSTDSTRLVFLDGYSKKKRKKRKTHKVKCEVCGKQFETEWSKKTICSIKCSQKKRSEKYRLEHPIIEFTKECDFCGGEFKTTKKRQKYCSYGSKGTCGYEVMKLKQRKYYHYVPKEKIIIEKTCLFCDLPFRTNLLKQKFCSRKCLDAFFNEWKKGNESLRLECAFCFKKFLPKNRKKMVKFCSKACKKDYDHFIKKIKKLEIISCKKCGKTFKQKNITQVFCSKKCRKDHQ